MNRHDPMAVDEEPHDPTLRQPKPEDEVEASTTPRNPWRGKGSLPLILCMIAFGLWYMVGYAPAPSPAPVASASVDVNARARQAGVEATELKEAANQLPQPAPTAAPTPVPVPPVEPVPLRPTSPSHTEQEAHQDQRVRESEVRGAPLRARGPIKLMDELSSHDTASVERLSATPSDQTATLAESDVLANSVAQARQIQGLLDKQENKHEDRQGPGNEAALAQRGRNAFLRNVAEQSARVRPVVADQAAPSGWVLLAGSVVEAVSEAKLSSELPGEFVAKVVRNVFDSRTHTVVLLPAGTKLLCKYDDNVATGQEALLVAVTQAILPDGRRLALGEEVAIGPDGRVGIRGEVNNHFFKRFGSALLLGLSASALPKNQSGTVTNSQGGGTTTTGSVAATALDETIRQILERNRSIGATIEGKLAQPFRFITKTDLVFSRPWQSPSR